MERSNQRVLTAWAIALMNVAALCNIKNFPVLAEYGLSIVFFLLLSTIFFFIPVALVSAELASGWPELGVYTWVKAAMGARMGFVAIWLQWIENVIWYPTILSFISATFAYVIYPPLAMNKTYIVCTILATFWIVTWINCFGMKISGRISAVSALLGTIFPIVIIIGLGAAWLLKGHPSYIDFSWKGLFPSFSSWNDLVLLSGVLFSFAGLEMTAVHAKSVANPRYDYPKGIFLSVAIILVLQTFGSLAIAIVVPRENIQLTAGGLEAFSDLFRSFHLSWATSVIAAIMTFGALGMMSTWIVGPSRGLWATAQHGDLPSFFHKLNKHQMPVHILIAQAVIVTMLSLVFLFMPSVNSSYWILIALAAILYMIMYSLLFLSGLILRYKHPNVARAYRLPGGKIGIWAISLLGLTGSLFGCFISFFPPSQLQTGSSAIFTSILVGGTLLFCLLPLLIYSKTHVAKPK